MKTTTLLGLLTLIFILISTGCGDDKKRTKYEELTVKVNTHDAKYEIYECSYEDAVDSGSGRHLEDWFLLPVNKCYRIRFEPVSGYETPEMVELDLKYGDPEIAEGMYVSQAGESTLMVRGNISDATWWVTYDPDGQTVAAGPSQWGEGDEWDSYVLEAYVSSPSNKYTVHCGDVAGYQQQPAVHNIELIVGQTTQVTCMYNSTGTGG